MTIAKTVSRAILLSLLWSCSNSKDAIDHTSAGVGSQLEQAAIETGVIRDPASTDLTGVYANDPERVCVVPATKNFHIGVTLDYGEGQRCRATGNLQRTAATLRIDLGDGCKFDARFDGEGIKFPGALPAACQTKCIGRATMAGLSVDMLSTSLSEAIAMVDTRGRTLCAPAGN